MPSVVPLRCRCGAVRGVMTDVSPDTGNRIVCHCDDCQAFARFLGQDSVLDAQGGTDIFHVSPSQIRITEGADRLACVRLSDKGLYRWYTACCKTPVGNMIGASFPFIGFTTAFLDPGAGGKTVDAVMGAPTSRIWGKDAPGGCPPNVHPKTPAGLMLRSGRLMIGWWIGRKGQPQPFFDGPTGKPVVAPRVLTKAERSALG